MARRMTGYARIQASKKAEQARWNKSMQKHCSICKRDTDHLYYDVELDNGEKRRNFNCWRCNSKYSVVVE